MLGGPAGGLAVNTEAKWEALRTHLREIERNADTPEDRQADVNDLLIYMEILDEAA